MLKIRLMRIGAKKRPFYRVVAVDERAKRTGTYAELLGTYNPLTEPKEIKLNQDRIDYWIKQGAQPSDGYLRIIGKASQRPPRKPKKERQQVTGGSEQVKQEVSEEAAKSDESESVGEDLQSEEVGTSEETGVDQTHSEVQETTTESEPTEPNGDSATDEQPNEEAAQEEEKTDERPA